jgi:hypothetical protein
MRQPRAKMCVSDLAARVTYNINYVIMTEVMHISRLCICESPSAWMHAIRLSCVMQLLVMKQPLLLRTES